MSNTYEAITYVPISMAVELGADDALAEHMAYTIYNGVVVHEGTGEVFSSKHHEVWMFYDARQGNTIAVVPFDDTIAKAIPDATFDLWSYMKPMISPQVEWYVEHYRRKQRLSITWLVIAYLVERLCGRR